MKSCLHTLSGVGICPIQCHGHALRWAEDSQLPFAYLAQGDPDLCHAINLPWQNMHHDGLLVKAVSCCCCCGVHMEGPPVDANALHTYQRSLDFDQKLTNKARQEFNVPSHLNFMS